MDEIDFISKVFMFLSKNEPVEYRLKSALEIMRNTLPVEMATLLFIPENYHDFKIISSGGRDELIKEYKEKFFFVDKYHNLPEDKVTVFYPGEETDDSLILNFQDFCINKVGIDCVAGVDFHFNQSLEVRLRLARTKEQGEFTALELKMIDSLIPHLKEAIDQAMHAQYHSMFDVSAQKVLTSFRIGMLIINKSMEILDSSSLADELLEKSNAFSCNKGKLITKSKDYKAKLEQIITELNGAEYPIYRTINITSAKSNEECTLAITRENFSNSDSLFMENRYRVFMFSPIDGTVDMSILVGLWRISPAEQKVLTAIMRYDNVKKVALELNISPNTAKAQLKSVYKKLGIVSKTMLIKKINSVRNMTALLS